MHAFTEPIFKPPRIIIEPFSTRNATLVEAKPLREFTDKIGMRSFCLQQLPNLEAQI